MGEAKCGGCEEKFVACVGEIGCFITRQAARGQRKLVKKCGRITQ